jgi:hypothetical protein
MEGCEMDECEVIYSQKYESDLVTHFRETPLLISIPPSGISYKADRFIEAAIRFSVERALDIEIVKTELGVEVCYGSNSCELPLSGEVAGFADEIIIYDHYDDYLLGAILVLHQ